MAVHNISSMAIGSDTYNFVDPSKYKKPSGGIPYSDLEDSVKASLDKADSALQESDIELLEQIGELTKDVNDLTAIPGDNEIAITDFTVTTDVTCTVDVETNSVTVTNNTNEKYNGVRTPATWGSLHLVPGRTYRLHAKAEAVSGSPELAVTVRGRAGNPNGAAVILPIETTGGEAFIDFVANQYMKEVQLFVSFGGTSKDSVSKFSEIWVKELTPYVCIPNNLKTALLQFAAKVAYIDDDGQSYYDDLYDALYDKWWEVKNTLSHCSTSNTGIQTRRNQAYTAIITASSGYTLTGASVSVIMGGADITSDAYSNGTVSIPAVTGNLVITITAAEE